MSKKKISPARKIEGAVELPGDKSISHRYAILAALAEGPSEILNYASAADCQSTLGCLRHLGIAIDSPKETHGRTVRIAGKGLEGLRAPRRTLDAENSGTTMRLLAGVLAGQKFSSAITGDASLRRRPMRRVLEPLGAMGARIAARDGGVAPLEIQGSQLRGVDYTPPILSAQVKSAILLAGLYADGETTVRESVATRDHLELALREFGARVTAVKGSISVKGRPRLEGRGLTVPGDLSSAVFFIAAALVLPGSHVMIHNVGLNPTRTRFLDLLISMGAPIQIASLQMRDGELTGDLAVHHAPIAGGSIAGAQTAEMIDELPMLAALGPYTENGVEIHDAKELRVKESDRIAALTESLRAMGAQVEEFPDGLRVAGRSAGKLRGAKIDPHGDHRIAMALSVAALGADGDTVILDAGCAGVSFPEFFRTLDRLVER
ncbi:MAG: 3-phosphoshikimate 1-carboxyvinyltransferase [Candidatus Acidiferrales bacterium]